MSIETLESDWAALLRLHGDLIVARHHGSPADPAIGSARLLARRYRPARRRFGVRLGEWSSPTGSAAGAGGRTPDGERILASIVACLPVLDELEPVAGALPGTIEVDDADLALRRSVLRRYARATATVRVDGVTIDRLTALDRLSRLDDPDARRRTFLSLAPIWRSIDGDGEDGPYRALVAASAARWDRDGSPIEANAAALGIEPRSIESMLWSILDTWRAAIGPGRREPWDHWFAAGAAARRLAGQLPVERLTPLNDAYLAALGADPAVLGIGYDLFPRPGRPEIPVAFTIGRGVEPRGSDAWRARPPWVFATYRTGGLANLGELLHESGHALHLAAIEARPAFAEFPAPSTAFLEATADVLGWDVDEPAWQGHWLGDAAPRRDALLHRYGQVVLDVAWALFELEIHRHPARRPNDAWTAIAADGLGLVPHPELSWWAMRGQLVESPGYLANYAFSAIGAAAIRAVLRAIGEDRPAGDSRWYERISDALFRVGSAEPPAALLERLLGGPLTAAALLDDLRSAAG